MDASNPMPRRLGLPLDPELQLWGGAVTPLRQVVVAPASWVMAFSPNPDRVAAYLWIDGSLGTFGIGTGGMSIVPNQLASGAPCPVLLHCRDYPGLVQRELWVYGGGGGIIQVADYVLQPWWSS